MCGIVGYIGEQPTKNFIIDGLNNLNIDVIATDAGNNVKNTYSDDEVIEHSKDADYIFVFWNRLILSQYL